MTSNDPDNTPTALFNPATETTPSTALAIYLEPPLSLQVWMTALQARPIGTAEAQAWATVERWRQEATAAAVDTLRQHARVLKRTPHTAVDLPSYQPCRLQLTTMSHHDPSLAPQDRNKDVLPVYRPHEHLLIGPHAEALDGSGRWRVDVEGLKQAAKMAQDGYLMTLRSVSRPLFTWRRTQRADYDPGPPEGLPPSRWDTPDPVMAGWEIDDPDVAWLLRYYLQHYCTNPEPRCIRPGRVYQVILAARRARNGDVLTVHGEGDDPRDGTEAERHARADRAVARARARDPQLSPERAARLRDRVVHPGRYETRYR